eukprot:UN25699
MGGFFADYYNDFVPILMKILNKSAGDDPELLDVHGRCLDMVGILGVAVGADNFKKDASNLLKLLLPSYNQGNIHDELESSVMRLFARIGKAMGEQFAPYLKQIIPGLIKQMSIAGGKIIKPDEVFERSENQKILEMDVHIRGVGDCKLLLDPVQMERQATAINMLFEYCQDLPIGFWPFLKESVKAIQPLMNYAYDSNVRNAAISIVTPMLRCCKEAIKRKDATQNDLKSLFGSLFPSFMKAINLEPKVEEKDLTLNAINETLQSYGLPMTVEQQTDTAELLNALIDEMIERRNILIAEEKNPDYDETMKAELQAQIDDENSFLQEIASTNKRVAQLSGGQYCKIFEAKLGKQMRNLLTRSVGEKSWALAMLDDLIEVAAPLSVQMYGKFLEKEMEKLQTATNEYIVQNVAYGINVLLNANALSDEKCTQWGKWLKHQMENPGTRSKLCRENCTSAFGIFCLKNQNSFLLINVYRSGSI